MRPTLSKLNYVLERRVKLTLVAATVVSITLALLDTLAITLVLPLVDLATGADAESGMIGWIGEALGNPDRSTLTSMLAVGVVGLFVLKDIGAVAYSWWLAGFKSVERVKLQSYLLHYFLTAPYTRISRRSSSDMVRSFGHAATQLYGTAVFGLMSLVGSVVSIVAIITALTITAPLPTLALLAYFGTASLLYFIVIKPIACRAGAVAAQADMDGWRTAFAAIGGIKELNLRVTQSFFVGRFREATLRGAFAGRTAEFVAGLPRYLLEILFIVAVGLFLILATRSGSGGSAIGVLSLFVAAGFRVLPSITGVLGSLTSFRFGVPYVDIVYNEIRDARNVQANAEEGGPPLPFRHVVSVDRVSFRYPGGETDVLSDVSLTIGHGTSVAIVGGSGAGKTTLVDVVLGLHDPSAGSVMVDGVDIAGRKRRWQQNLGYVAQDVYLLDATLAENIAFDLERSDIDEVILRNTIHQAQLEELVSELPEGVDTQIGERGARLSGGQKQRVGIARALYRQPQLLVLDEATSALDNETEHRITQTINALHGEITVVIVAHRLSTVRHCDQVVFLKEGRVDAVGSFEEVRNKSADFALLVRLGSLDAKDRRPSVESAIEAGTEQSAVPG